MNTSAADERCGAADGVGPVDGSASAPALGPHAAANAAMATTSRLCLRMALVPTVPDVPDRVVGTVPLASDKRRGVDVAIVARYSRQHVPTAARVVPIGRLPRLGVAVLTTDLVVLLIRLVLVVGISDFAPTTIEQVFRVVPNQAVADVEVVGRADAEDLVRERTARDVGNEVWGRVDNRATDRGIVTKSVELVGLVLWRAAWADKECPLALVDPDLEDVERACPARNTDPIG